MMKCDIIRDLLPLYCDGLCSEASKQEIEAHVAQCQECCACLAEMMWGFGLKTGIWAPLIAWQGKSGSSGTLHVQASPYGEAGFTMNATTKPSNLLITWWTVTFQPWDKTPTFFPTSLPIRKESFRRRMPGG